MDSTYAQIFELLLEVANSENGTNLLMKATFKKSEHGLHQLENFNDYANGLRTSTSATARILNSYRNRNQMQ